MCIRDSDVVAMHIKASRPKAITMELELKLLRQANVVASGNQLIYTGNAEFEKHGKGCLLYTSTPSPDSRVPCPILFFLTKAQLSVPGPSS